MDSLPPEAVAEQFADKYYADFHANRQAFVQYFYRDHSTLTFESTTFQGLNAIGRKWTEDFLKTAELQATTKDAQRAPGGFIVLITGLIRLGPGEPQMQFTQSFLISSDHNGVFCHNDLFRLVYA